VNEHHPETPRPDERRLQIVLESAPVAVVMVDRPGTIVLVNAATEKLFGYRRDELLGQPVEMLLPARLREAHPQLRAAFFDAPRARPLGSGRDLFGQRKDGTEVAVEIGLNPIETDEGRFVLSTISDITLRKQAERELKQLNEQLEQRVAERTAEATARAAELEQAAQSLREEVARREQIEADLREAKEAAEAASLAKSTFLANMSHEIRTPLNAAIGMADLLSDTPLNRQQREFLKMIHESGESLLEVINDILDFSKIEAGHLELEHAAFEHREMLGDTMKTLGVKAHRKGLELLCRIASDIPPVLVGDRARLRQILWNLVGNAIKFTERGEVALNVELKSPSRNPQGDLRSRPVARSGDRPQRGNVELQTRTDDTVVLKYTVRDTGIGIPADKLEHVFEAFEQADSSTTRRFGGTGLGLTICRRLVDLMGGHIDAESRLGEGSTFRFTLPLGLTDEPLPEPATPDRLCDMPVLVVDDNRTNRRILCELLRNWRMVPTEAGGAEEALAVLREARQAGRPFRLVLIDAHMPGVDGFTPAERIMADKRLDSTVIMMLSSGDRPGDGGLCEKLGVGAYLIKPVKQSELLDAILLAMRIVPDEEPAAAGATRSFGLPPLNVLVAEDSVINQKLARALLEKHGHRVETAQHGREALEKLKKGRYDVVLMDVQMPELDGLETTRSIRARERVIGGRLPIVAVTAHALKGDRERCLAAGMDQYVAKPLRQAELFGAMARALSRGGSATAEVVRPEPADTNDRRRSRETLGDTSKSPNSHEFGYQDASQHRSAAPAIPAEDEPVDWSVARAIANQDDQLLAELAAVLLREMPRYLTELRQSCERGDLDTAARAAHTLKGHFRVFGARSPMDCALRIETQLRSGDSDVGDLLTSLERQGQRVCDAVATIVR
jgi:PAS domain S-box-containing protein